MGIIGTMGTGKTQFARSVICQLSRESLHNIGGSPIGVLIFDYKGDYKDSSFLDATQGVACKARFPFNPLKLIVTRDLEGVNLPAVTADRLSDSFAKAYGLGLKQQGNIKQVIIATYAESGITADPSTWGNPPPVMDQEKGYRQLRSFIMVDEAQQFLKKDFNSLRSIISEGRMFGVGMILSTQNPSDFHSANEDYSQFILSWVIHHVNTIGKAEISGIFGAANPHVQQYAKRINDAKIFESVCKIGNNVYAMRDLPFFELMQRGEHGPEHPTP